MKRTQAEYITALDLETTMNTWIKSTILAVTVTGLFATQSALANTPTDTTNVSAQNTAGSTQKLAVIAPSPEPDTYAMMLAGLGLMGFVARRRKQVQELA